jgi:hypothetical protein
MPGPPPLHLKQMSVSQDSQEITEARGMSHLLQKREPHASHEELSLLSAHSKSQKIPPHVSQDTLLASPSQASHVTFLQPWHKPKRLSTRLQALHRLCSSPSQSVH